MSLINSLNWRYATTKFDNSKAVSEQHVNDLKEIIRLTPASWGFQFYKVLVISNNDLKAKLLPAAYNQSQIVDCSHLFVICSFKEVFESDVDDFTHDMHQQRQDDDDYNKDSIDKYTDGAKKSVLGMNKDSQQEWLKKQCYIALGQMLVGCADLKIDACPIEGFKSDEFDRILELNDKNYSSTIIIPVGYRSENDTYQFKTKVRKETGKLFEDR